MMDFSWAGGEHAMILSLLAWIGFWFAGMVIGSHFLVAPVRMLRFDVPATLYLCDRGLLTSANSLLRRLLLSASVCIAVLLATVATIALTAGVFPGPLPVFLVSVVLELFAQRRKTGWTAGNVRQYLKSYRRYFDQPVDAVEAAIWRASHDAPRAVVSS